MDLQLGLERREVRQYLIDRTLRMMAAYAQGRMRPEEDTLKSDRRSIPADHKCWGCMWATWCGDKFFCPLAFTCIREKLEVVDGTEETDGK